MTNDLSTRARASFPAFLLDVRPPRFLRRSGGRETFLWELGSRRVVVKRTLGAGRTRPSGRREHEVLLALRADGIPVPQAISWCHERGSLLRGSARSIVVMEHVEHRENLRERLATANAAERQVLAGELLDVVARLHEAGWYHRDLYLQHFLVACPRKAIGPPLVLIDVGRARREKNPRRRWFVKDLAALLVSCPAAVPGRERLRFLSAYLARRGIRERAVRRAWARRVLAKAARMGAHVPRDERGAD